jgi:hypothetical protein
MTESPRPHTPPLRTTGWLAGNALALAGAGDLVGLATDGRAVSFAVVTVVVTAVVTAGAGVVAMAVVEVGAAEGTDERPTGSVVGVPQAVSTTARVAPTVDRRRARGNEGTQQR